MGSALVLIFVAIAAITAGDGAAAAEKLVVGWVEKVRIFPGDLEVHAKMDSGAKTSSLNAPDLRMSTRDGADWVSFSVTNRRGMTQRFEERVIRISKIRRHGGDYQLRPVIMLGVCVGPIYQETQVNLTDRNDFNYQMLIGRRFMTDQLVVDPGRTFLARPTCSRAGAK